MRNPYKRAWNLQHDGDRWEIFWQAALSRGPSSIKLTKIKAHATDEHVENWTTTQTRKDGNDRADMLGEKGASHQKRLQPH